MRRKKKYYICMCTLIAAVFPGLLGCSEGGVVKTGHYFLCNDSYNSEPGILLYDPNGEEILQLDQASVDCCLDAEGNTYNSVGEIPENSYLFISLDDPEQGSRAKAGLWSVKKQDWELEPQSGGSVCRPENGVVKSLGIGNTEYFLDEADKEAEYSMEDTRTFTLNDDFVLKNGNDPVEGACITYPNGEIYLSARDLYEKNRETGLVETIGYGIQIECIIADEYLLICHNAGTIEIDGQVLGDNKYYVCDMEGKMIQPEKVYDSFQICANWPSYTKPQYLQLKENTGTDEEKTAYINLSEGTYVKFPQGYENNNIVYDHAQYFKLYDGKEWLIYDAEKETTGASFAADYPYEGIVVGQNSYMINREKEKKIVIDGNVYADEGECYVKFVQDQPYKLLRMDNDAGDYMSYIVDSQEQLVLETDENVLYADETYYLVLEDDNTYKICFY